MKIKILYEDKNILAIDKPSGVSVHQAPNDKNYSICDWVMENYPEMKGVGEPMGEIDRPGIVHRLDKETSGVMLLAKNQEAHEWLKEQFSAPAIENKQKAGLADRQNHIKKTYVAIVDGWIKKDGDIINEPIGRSPSDFRRRLSGRGARGEMRDAITEYKVIKRFEVDGQKYTLVELMPKTGRTHQIRVHMKFLNTPVVCDSLYAPKNLCPQIFGRLMLHAKSIEFKDLSGKAMKVESPLPKEFSKVL